MPLAHPGRRVLRCTAGIAATFLALLGPGADAQTGRASFTSGTSYLVLDALDDDLIRFAFGSRESGVRAAAMDPTAATDVPTAIATTPMVSKTDHPGARRVSTSARGIETDELSVVVDTTSLCFTVTDRKRRVTLTAVCPTSLAAEDRAMSLTRERTQHVYGLGEQFVTLGSTDGDWVGRERTPGTAHGNRMVGFEGGAIGNAMFPVMYAVGGDGGSYALFLDNTHAQRWDFRSAPWRVGVRGGELTGYLMSGPDLPDLRRDYLELTGMPLVPPRQVFGLWVSEFGFDHWHELESKLATLRENRFPVDGFVLDLQWFGGIVTGSDETPMGSLSWDLKRFPEPAARIERLRREHGIGIIPIEESYIGRALPEHDTLQARGFLVRQRENGPPVYLTENPWWGKGGMIDWTNEGAGTFWHDWKRQPLVDVGVVGHWTDLGEPELYDSTAWYHGVVPGRHSHADNHNLYNLAWSRSIAEGYRRHGVQRRPLILSRSGTSGSQRYGVAMWSGDIGANLASLATHMNAQMHMAMSGIDYFGSDIGGFHRGGITGDSLAELYTQWFANGAMLEVPIRAHTENLCNCKETAPDRVGHVASNLANLRLRYSLTPYYYSLAHRARRFGEPLVAPPVYYYQGDTTVRTMGHEKLVGRDLLVGVVASHGARQRDVYLPAGTWVDFHTNARHEGGRWLRDVPLYRDGLFRLPLYVRAGAILPRMHVDEQTMNTSGRRLDGTSRSELIVRVYPQVQPTEFVLYEDDGETIAYLDGAVATTTISQRASGDRVTVTIGARAGSYAGAPTDRASVVELVTDRRVTAVRVGTALLQRHATREALDAAGSGWVDLGDGVVVARAATAPVTGATAFEFRGDGR